MRTFRIAAVTAVLLALASGGALAHSQMGHGQSGRMHGGVQVRGAGHVQGSAGSPQFSGGLRRDGRLMHNGRFANDPRFANDGRLGPDGRFAHDGRVHGGHFVHDGRIAHHGHVHGGQFVHGFHRGRVGLWLVAGGFWYPWPQYAAVAPVYVAPPAANVWYYCQSAGGYYPYVTDCPEGWLVVVPAPA